MHSLILVLPLLVGCGGAHLILKPPVQEQCDKAKLKGCDEMTEGVLVYVEGDKPKGKDHIMRGAAQNAPDKVRQFAKAIKELPLDKIPGAQKYTKIILEVADILASAKGGPGGPGGGDDPGSSGEASSSGH
jgi:hypothetical protein